MSQPLAKFLGILIEESTIPCCRTNIAYVLNSGKVYVSAFLKDASKASQVTISVARDVTTTPDMIPNGAAAQTLVYQPRAASLDYLSLALGSSMAAANTASLLVGLIAMSLNPFVPAGSPRLHPASFATQKCILLYS